jgi:glycosyltransferase involved in cell wall biosynthesis
MNVPLITILMPAYNAEKYIAAAIASALDQTIADFELLIINDGSTDNTEKIIHSFTDKRIRLINQPNQGVAAALNHGLSKANAGYIARFDADDISYPFRLERQYHFLQKNSGYILVGSDAEYIDMHGEFVFTYRYKGYSNEEIKKLDYHICPFSHATVFYDKQAVIDAGMYDVNAHNFEDHLLWRKLIGLGKVHNLAENLVQYRFNPESVTIDEKWRGHRFSELKYKALKNGNISKKDGDEIWHIIKSQNIDKIKKGSYYSLLAKKYLFNNYQPAHARKNISQLIKTYPLKLQGYMLMGLSFFPEKILKSIYKVK